MLRRRDPGGRLILKSIQATLVVACIMQILQKIINKIRARTIQLEYL